MELAQKILYPDQLASDLAIARQSDSTLDLEIISCFQFFQAQDFPNTQ